MKRFIIDNCVNTRSLKPEEVRWSKETLVAEENRALGYSVMSRSIATTGTAVSSASAGLAALLKSSSVTKITTLTQLRRYRNCLSGEWKKRTVYIEHPCCQNVLIEAAEYKNQILQEMLSEISDYIMDHMAVKELIVGLISTSRVKGKAGVPMADDAAYANLSCQLEKSYRTHIKNARQRTEPREYVWIRRFPNVISAVEHDAGEMEVRQKIRMDLDVGFKFGAYNGNANAGKDYEFYVKYERA